MVGAVFATGLVVVATCFGFSPLFGSPSFEVLLVVLLLVVLPPSAVLVVVVVVVVAGASTVA